MSGWSRQQPGSACEECRKKKLRCDRQRPQCGTCSDADITCEFNTKRLRRGPKQGGLKVLRSRVATLESLLRRREEDGQPPVYDNDRTENTPSDGSGSDGEQSQASETKRRPYDKRPSPPQSYRPSTDAQAPAVLGSLDISELMRTDLDHLYFERVHPIVPILQKHRYFSWANKSIPNIHHKCLQFAMWTLAMSLSTQFESVRETMYTETRQMLETLDLCESDMGSVRIEQAQAWILVTFYEFLRTNYRRGYISAGRVFRLVQLLRLHEVDSLTINIGNSNPASGGDWVATEERRRAFWVAYCLDRFISIGNRGLLTLSEEVICTCLPSLETDFQNGHAAQIWFLSEAIASSSQFSPLAECAIMATICGRVLSHNHVSAVEQVYGNAALDFWVRHEWLNSILITRRDSLALNHPSVSAFADPMLIFAFMAVHATTIYLCEVAESLKEVEQYRATIIEYQNQALWAAREIARLSKEQEQVGHFKASYSSLFCSPSLPSRG
ncbi:MAG: hypothetical protein Q9225_002591 [Loekoesia sp. 1 TL-2023]